MRKSLTVTASAGLGALLLSTGAQAQSIGTDMSSIRRSYAQAQELRIGEQRILELRDVDYAGFKWSTVDFVFDAAQHLTRLQMTSREAPYEQILRMAAVQLQSPDPVRPIAAADPGGPDMQIRVCEGEGGQVTVTYEGLAQVS